MYLPHRIIALVDPRTDPQAWFEGACKDAVQNANLPCSLDSKKSLVGQMDRRVVTDAKISVPWTDESYRKLIVGTRIAVEQFPGYFWEIKDIGFKDGVFGNARMLDLFCVRIGSALPPTDVGGQKLDEASRAARRVKF